MKWCSTDARLGMWASGWHPQGGGASLLRVICCPLATGQLRQQRWPANTPSQSMSLLPPSPLLAEGEAAATVQAFTHFSLPFLRNHLGCDGMVLDAQVSESPHCAAACARGWEECMSSASIYKDSR